jgi:hypothetical protein
MDYLWRILLAIVGLLLLRWALYRKVWGHGKLIVLTVAVILCAGLLFPLARMGSTGNIIVVIATAFLLFPYRQVLLGWFQWYVKASIRKLANYIEGQLREDRQSGLYEAVIGEAADGGPTTWAGNVIYHVRSLHPGIRTRQDYYSLAFVVRLEESPPFQCSLLKGEHTSQYFETEWRETTIMRGELTSVVMGQLLSEEKGRDTGGKLSDLTNYSPATDSRFNSFKVLVKGEEHFERVFFGDLLDKFFSLTQARPDYELNITPTSVNIFTQSGPFQYIKQNMDFLRKLTERVVSVS